jgi:Ran GTPase-activating protein (RanGAP) involved in mRNA processing and transport
LTGLEQYINLETLKIGGSNKITELTALDSLKKLTKLGNLDLEGTELSKTQDYRKTVFHLFPHLEVLDSKDLEGNSVYSEIDDEEGEEEVDAGDFIDG